MALYCLDASVVLARLFREPYPLVADFWRTVSRDDELMGAELLRPECTAVIRENVSKGRFLEDDGREMIEELLVLPLSISNSALQFRRANELALRFRLQKAYDVQYLAAAEAEGGQIVTIDGGMRQHARQLGVPCVFLR